VYSRGSATVTVVRRPADLARRRKLVRLLAELLDKPDTPDKDGQP
jgi:hypothetical protein